jgi:hypothetical protein
MCILASQQQNNNDHDIKKSSSPIGSNRSRTSKVGTSFSSVVRLSSTHPTRTNSNLSHEHRSPSKEKPSTTSSAQTSRCPHCPHCQRVPAHKKSTVPQPSWIIEDPGTDARHIILDNFDEDAVRDRVISEKGHVSGGYDYLRHLTIEETKNPKDLPNKHCTLPVIATAGSPISPARTPFPNYDIIHRREHWLDKPYTSKLFTN